MIKYVVNRPYCCNVGTRGMPQSPANAMLKPYSSRIARADCELLHVCDEFMGMKIFKGIACKPLLHPSRSYSEIFLQR